MDDGSSQVRDDEVTAAAGAAPWVRARSVDVLRGAVLAYLALLVVAPTTGWRGHALWWGWRPSDVFFPGFLLVGGAGLALQSRRTMPWPRLLRRFVALLAVGLAVNALLGRGLDLSTLRGPGVLQRIAVVGLLGAAVAAALRRSWWAVGLAAVAVTLLWGVLLTGSASGCVDGEPTPDGCGTFLWLDERAFGVDHVYQQGAAGHDPEGLASTLGALGTFLAGFAAGRLLVDLHDRSTAVRAGAVAAMGAGWLAVTPAALAFAPFGKRMWTPAFVTLNAAAGLAALAALVAVVDAPVRQRTVDVVRHVVTWPFEAVGRNALVLWMLLTLADHALLVTPSGEADLQQHLLDSLGAGGFAALFGGAWLAVAAAMHAARWHVRL